MQGVTRDEFNCGSVSTVSKHSPLSLEGEGGFLAPLGALHALFLVFLGIQGGWAPDTLCSSKSEDKGFLPINLDPPQPCSLTTTDSRHQEEKQRRLSSKG
jgi:hypothetical protein